MLFTYFCEIRFTIFFWKKAHCNEFQFSMNIYFTSLYSNKDLLNEKVTRRSSKTLLCLVTFSINKSLVDFSIVLFCRNLYSKQLSCQLVNNIFVKRLGFSLLRMLSKWKEKIVWPFFCCWSPNPHTFSKFFLPVHGRNTSGQLNPFVVAILLVLSPTPRTARNYIPRVPKMLYIQCWTDAKAEVLRP